MILFTQDCKVVYPQVQYQRIDKLEDKHHFQDSLLLKSITLPRKYFE